MRRALCILALPVLAACPRLDPMQTQQKYEAYQASDQRHWTLKCPACDGVSHRDYRRRGFMHRDRFTLTSLAEIAVLIVGPLAWPVLIAWQRSWWAVILPVLAFVAFLVWLDSRSTLVPGPPQRQSR